MDQEQGTRIIAGGIMTLLLVGGISTLIINQNSPEDPSQETKDTNQEQTETVNTDDTVQDNTSDNEENTNNQEEDADTSENKVDSEEENSEKENDVDSEDKNSETENTDNTDIPEEDVDTSENETDSEENSDSEENEGEQDTKTSKIGTGDFQYSKEENVYSGTVFLRGYTSTRNLERFPGPYVYFNIQESDNEVFDTFVQSQQRNTFYGKDKVGLGCAIDDKLNYLNNSTSKQSGTELDRYIKSTKESQAILNSTKNNPITIQLNRYYNDGSNAMGGPLCFSDFTQVNVMDGDDLMFESDIEEERTRGNEYDASSDSVSQNDGTFKLTVDTDSDDGGANGGLDGVTDADQFQIPTNPEYEYDYSVDWGDGKSDENVTGDITHTYDEPGRYEISIDGQFPAIQFGRDYQGFEPPFTQTTDGEKVVAITQWGDIQWQSMEKAFLGAKSVQSEFGTFTDAPDLSQVENMSQAFRRMPGFTVDIGDWDVSNVEDMSYMFAGDANFNADISDWDTSNVENMAGMFRYASLFNQDISNWCVENIEEEPYDFDTFTEHHASWDEQEKPNWGEDCQ